MAKFHAFVNNERFLFWCPGCKDNHQIKTGGPGPCWEFNGDLDKPTCNPSLLVRYGDKPGDKRCHSFIRDGKMHFCDDCTHELAGQVVEIPEWEEDDG